MRLTLIQCLLLFVSLSYSSVSYRKCEADINNLWLDIVVVIDNTKIMQMDGVYDTIKNMFGPNVTIGEDMKNPRTTRVAIVTYNEKATVVADFDKLSSLSELDKELDKLNQAGKSESFDAFMDLGLEAANSLILDSNDSNQRKRYKKLIVLFTSNYSYKNQRPDVLALSIRQTGVNIATVYTGAGSTGNTQFQLTFVGNYNMNFHMADSKPIVEELQNATLLTNCFCRNGWYQYTTSSGAFGVCVASLNEVDYQSDARKYCHEAAKNSYLATEFNNDKKNFNYNFIKSSSSKPVSSYYIGLLSKNGTWFWDQPDGQRLLPLDPSSGSVPSTSGCVADVKYSDGSIKWTSISCGNRFPYICEMSTCDTDNYCF